MLNQLSIQLYKGDVDVTGVPELKKNAAIAKAATDTIIPTIKIL